MDRDDLWYVHGYLFGEPDPADAAAIASMGARAWLRSLPDDSVPVNVCCVEVMQHTVFDVWGVAVYGPIKRI